VSKGNGVAMPLSVGWALRLRTEDLLLLAFDGGPSGAVSSSCTTPGDKVSAAGCSLSVLIEVGAGSVAA
jgi:hypothetical protein